MVVKPQTHVAVSLKLPHVYPKPPQEYLRLGGWVVGGWGGSSSPASTFVKLRALEVKFQAPPAKPAAQLEANWLAGIKTVMGVFSFQPFAESQHRPKAENNHMDHRNNSRGPLLCKPCQPVGNLPLFLGLFPATSGLLVHSIREKHTGGGLGWGKSSSHT